MRVRVLGLPQQQGSKKAFVVKGRAIMSDANEKNLKPWRGHVTQTVGEAWGDAPLLTGPVKMVVTFAFPRPASHYGTGRNAGVLKASAPSYKTSAPDLDKLQRAIGDALSGTVFRDDAQVAVWDVSKVYAETTYADIEIIDLSGGSHDDARRTAPSFEGPDSGRGDLAAAADPHRDR